MKTIKLFGDALAAALELQAHSDETRARLTEINEEVKKRLDLITMESNNVAAPLMSRIYTPHGIDVQQNIKEGKWTVWVMAESMDAYLINIQDDRDAPLPTRLIPTVEKNKLN